LLAVREVNFAFGLIIIKSLIRISCGFYSWMLNMY